MRPWCLVLLLAAAIPAWSAEKKIRIQSDTSNLPAPLVHNFAHVALAMGAQEPLAIAKELHTLIIQGSGTTRCLIQLNEQNNSVLGVSCR